MKRTILIVTIMILIIPKFVWAQTDGKFTSLTVEGSPFPTVLIIESRTEGQARLQQLISEQTYWLLGPEKGAAFANSYTFYNPTGGHILVLEENGNVGIGEMDPAMKLDVAGSVKATSFYGRGSSLTGIPTLINMSKLESRILALESDIRRLNSLLRGKSDRGHSQGN